MPSFRFLKVGILLLQASVAWAQNDDLFEFFAAEAQVITASRRPQAILQAPATVYVVTAEDIEASGAHNLWDALRSVPGVDVMSSRTSYGEVSIRGLNKAFNNRTLVLVDGRSVLNGDQDRINWTSLPVLLEEIERIEVVEGPASALYGANAISGVINIITKTPQQTQGAQLNYTVGERRTHLGSLLYSGRQQKLDYRLGLGWRTTNRFENDALRASEVMVLHGLLGYELSSGARLNLSGGGTRAETNASLGALSEGIEDADRGFVRADYVRRDTRLRFFWEGESGHLESLAIPQDPSVDYDFYDLNLEHTLVHAPRHNLVVGGGYRQADFQSDVITSGRVQHNLWALFFENEWRPADSWALWASGRLDQHPHTDLVFSPRFSAIFIPVPEHALRFSTGTSFRNPTLIENHVDFVEPVEVPELDLVLDFEFLGNTAMEPERLLFFEVAHSAQMGRIKTTAAGFHYRLKDGISSSASGIDVVDSAKIAVTTSFQNRGETRAWGGELGAEFLLGDRLREAIETDDRDAGALSIGCSGSFAMLLSPLLLDWMASAPALTIRLVAAPQGEIRTGLLEGRFDLGVLGADPGHARLEGQYIGREELCLVLPKEAPDRMPDFIDLEARGFIAHPDGFGYADELLALNFPDAYPGADRLQLRGVLNQIGQIPAPVAEGIGYTLLPRSGVEAFASKDRLRVAPMAQRRWHELWLVNRKGRAATARAAHAASLIREAAQRL